MNSSQGRLLFLNCDQPGHENHALTHICLAVYCLHQGLACALCVKTFHLRHYVEPLGKFLRIADDLRFKVPVQQPQPSSTVTSYIKQMKINFMKDIEIARDKVVEQLKKLEESGTAFYDRLLQQTQYQRTPSKLIDFAYDASLELGELNQRIKELISFVRVKSQSFYRQEEKRMHRELQDKTNRLKEMLGVIVAQFYNTTVELARIFSKSETGSVLSWSNNEKHSDATINSGVVCRTGRTVGVAVIVLSSYSLPSTFSWRIKIHCVQNWMALGIMSRRQAKRFNYTEKRAKEELLNQYAISNKGRDERYICKIKSGSRFPFAAGDVIELGVDLSRGELVCKKEPNCICTIGVERLTDPSDAYYCSVLMLDQDDQVELIQ